MKKSVQTFFILDSLNPPQDNANTVRFIVDTFPVSSQKSTDIKSDASDDERNDNGQQDVMETEYENVPRDTGNSRNDKDEPQDWDEADLQPRIIWLASYPNSGTSYTMKMVERASNHSTATNYGHEVTAKGHDSIPVFSNHIEGPYWEGLSGRLGTIRQLPSKKILTKTHCGGRCIHCGADRYVVKSAGEFLKGCRRTTRLTKTGKTVEHLLPTTSVQGIIHILRNPFHNIVARFHLDRRNIIHYHPENAVNYTLDAKGFSHWCHDLDTNFSSIEEVAFRDDPKLLELLRQVPCRAEFYKYVQWHNWLSEIIPRLGRPANQPVPKLTVFYEHYRYAVNETATQLFQFLELPIVNGFEKFRDRPNYADHYDSVQRQNTAKLVKYVSSNVTWKLIQHYFEGLRSVE